MNDPLTRLRPTRVFAAVMASIAAHSAFGAGFQLNENSGSGLGNAFAGGAAVAEDASTLWSNVAGISRLGTRQAAGAIHLITPSIKFRDEFSAPAILQPLGNDGGDAGGLNVVPNVYFAMPLNPQWSVGVGVNAPWGLVTEYGDGWIGRFQAIKSEIKTININPGA
jgi:long-chain fatty acid transport protein